MRFSDYQQAAQATDLQPTRDLKGRALPLLGLQRKLGELVSACRDVLEGALPATTRDLVADEIGDMLWYLSNIASKVDVDLDEAAAANLRKVRDRWHLDDASGQRPLLREPRYLDDVFPDSERLPRRFRVRFEEVPYEASETGTKLKISYRGFQLGDLLTDNAPEDDGYRYHDVLHLAYVACLGWSPVIRSLLKIKRKSKSKVDEIEDGARGRDLEEAITAFVFQYARKHSFFKGAKHVDTQIISAVRTVVGHLEVESRSAAEWEHAILNGYAVFRKILTNRGGFVSIDMTKASLSYRPLDGGELPGSEGGAPH